MSTAWRKAESKAGYPYYKNADTGAELADHPELAGISDSLQQHAGIKYAAYRTAFKIYELQKRLQVASVRVSAGVLARHCLSISESSLTLEACELEAVLSDIYFAAAREGTFRGDPDAAAQLLLSLMLNLFDPDRNTPVRVQSVKILLMVLSPETSEEKWTSLVETCADHNGCVSARRLSGLLEQLARLTEYVGETEAFGQQRVQADVDRCFAKSAGMLGMSTRAVVAWAVGGGEGGGGGGCAHARWLAALERVRAARLARPAPSPAPAPAPAPCCSACGEPLVQMLIFRCAKCCVLVCERCYLHGRDLTAALSGHKKTHTLQEVLSHEISPKYLGGFMKDLKKFFSCSKHCTAKRPRNSSKPSTAEKVDTAANDCQANDDDCQPKANGCQADGEGCKVNGGRKVFTSTVGKAAGGGGPTPHALLQDIIAQLESQNRALKDLSGQLESGTDSADDKLRHKVDAHWGHIATQINRLKILKENLTASSGDENAPTCGGVRLQAFDLFSPIPMLQEEKPAKASEAGRCEPRVLSLDSGRFSEASKTSEAPRPIAMHATTDSVSAVSMNDISTWYGNERGDEPVDKTAAEEGRRGSLRATEARFAADVRCVASSNHKMKELNADLDTVLDRLQRILTDNFLLDDSRFDNSQLRETANEMEGLLGTLIRGVEQRATRRRLAASVRAPPAPPPPATAAAGAL